MIMVSQHGFAIRVADETATYSSNRTPENFKLVMRLTVTFGLVNDSGLVANDAVLLTSRTNPTVV